MPLFCESCQEGPERCLCVDPAGRPRHPANWQRIVGRQPDPTAIAHGVQKATVGPRPRRAWETAIAARGSYPTRWKAPRPARKASQRKSGAAPERDVLRLLQDAAELMGVTLLRNNVGTIQDKSGRYHIFGLGIGSPDLVGWQTVTVTPEMVGTKLAVFVGVEAKREAGGTVSERQGRYLERLRQAGACAGVARSVEDLQGILRRPEK